MKVALTNGRDLLKPLACHEVKLEPVDGESGADDGGAPRVSVSADQPQKLDSKSSVSPSSAKPMTAAAAAAAAAAAQCPKDVLDYSDASACAMLKDLDFYEFFSRDGADLEWELNRVRDHKLYPAYQTFLREDEMVDEDFVLLGLSVHRLGSGPGFATCEVWC